MDEEKEGILASEVEETHETQGEGMRISHKYGLYTSHFLSSFGDRMVQFGSVIFVMAIFSDTLLPVSVLGFVVNIFGLFFNPKIGTMLDKTNRIKAMRVALIVQNSSVIIVCICYIILIHNYFGVNGETYLRYSIFALSVFFSSVAQMATTATDIAVEKDWVVVLSRSNTQTLTDLNSTMRRIDLICKLCAPIFLGSISTLISTGMSVIFVASWNVVSFFAEIGLLQFVYHGNPSLAQKKSVEIKQDEDTKVLYKLKEFVSETKNNWAAYYHQRVFRASLGYCCLYATVLCLGELDSSYLKSTGIEDVYLAIARGVSALVGILATYMMPHMSKRIGLERTGLWSIHCQLICLIPCVFVLSWPSVSTSVSSWVIIASVCASRLGLWSFDLVETQLMQERVEGDVSGRVNSVQSSIINLMNILTYLTTMVFHRPEQFLWPVCLSVGSVGTAALLYTSWVKIERGHLFHFHCLSKYSKLEKNEKNKTQDLHLDQIDQID